MSHRFLVCLPMVLALLGAAAAPVRAVPPEPGIMRVTSALPRTLPLHVRSPLGQDMLVRLQDAESGAEILVAYGRGGTMLRVLVPPGRFTVSVATGRDWIDAVQLFGPQTQLTTLGPLDFGIAGRARRNGHLITILPDGKAVRTEAAPLAWCQSLHVERDLTPFVELWPDGVPDVPPTRRLRSFPCG